MRVALIAATAAFLVLPNAIQAHPLGKHESEVRAPLVHMIRYYRGETNEMLRAMGERRYPVAYLEANESKEFRQWLLSHWKARYREVRNEYSEWRSTYGGLPGWWVGEAMLVHSCEGAWNANTGNGYYGGLQMDISFQTTYGPEFYRAYGTANNWPVFAQLRAAYRGWQARGWSPWPACAARFGLL
jgi:Transglycosylase-like domain